MVDLSKPGERMLAVQGMDDLTHAERTVLSVIAYHDGPGGASPSMERIAGLAGMKRSTVAAHLQSMRAKGRLSWVHGRHANTYRVLYEPDSHCQEIPDTDTDSQCQGIPVGHCQGFLDGNRKEPEWKKARWRWGAECTESPRCRDWCGDPVCNVRVSGGD